MNQDIQNSGRFLDAASIPETNWVDLRPFWPRIGNALAEVFVEGNFKPYPVTKARPDGFFASEWYWRQASVSSSKYPLREARKFIEMLSKRQDFLDAVREFNGQSNSEWSVTWKDRAFRVFLYAICYPLIDFLAKSRPISPDLNAP